MATIELKLKLPTFLPVGWKSETAKSLRICRKTVYNALKKGHGETYNRIMAHLINRYGIPEKPNN